MSAIVANDYKRNKIHPKKFALLVGCASIFMMFAAFTSAYIVRKAGGNWLEFQLPNAFFISTAVLLLSSISMHTAYSSFLKGNEKAYKGFLILTFILGIAFVVLQYKGWEAMQAIGVPLKINPSGDFVYVISGVHAAHVLGGLAILIVAMIHAFGLKYNVTPARKLRFELSLIYWHFMDFLWVYLLIFFLLQS